MIQPNEENINKANECLKNFSSLSDTFILLSRKNAIEYLAGKYWGGKILIS